MKDPDEPVRWDASESDAPDDLRRALTALGDAERPEAAELQRLRERLMTVFEAPPPQRFRLMHALGGSMGVLAIGLALVAGWIGWQRFERDNVAPLPPTASEQAAQELARPGVLGADETASGARVVEPVEGVDAAVRGNAVRALERGGSVSARGDDVVNGASAPSRERGANGRARDGADVRGAVVAARKSERHAVRTAAHAEASAGSPVRTADGASEGAAVDRPGAHASVATPAPANQAAVTRAGEATLAPANQAAATRTNVAARAGEATPANQAAATRANVAARAGEATPANQAGATRANVAARAGDAALAPANQASAPRASYLGAAAHVNQSAAREPAPADAAGPRLPAADGGNTVLLDEATLLQRARRLSSSDPEQALRVLDEHKRRFPAGMLSPEREVLAIELLRSLARGQEADRRARAFRRNYPKSVYLPRIEP